MANKIDIPASFKWLNFTQFFGALNDNLFKLFITFALISSLGSEQEADIISKISAIFTIPFLLFAAPAGYLADKISKQKVIVYAKGLELFTMCFATWAFYSDQLNMLYYVLFIMSLQSAFFGPAKYGAIPEIVGKEAIPKANGQIQAFTYIAMILGTVLAPAVTQLSNEDYTVAGLFCVCVALFGFVNSLFLPHLSVTEKPDAQTWEFLKVLKQDRYLLITILAASSFLFIGALIQLVMIPFGREVLGLEKEVSSYLFIFAALGIGTGSLLAAKVSGRNIEFGIVPIGAFGMSIVSFLIAIMPPGHVVLFCSYLFIMCMCGGIFLIPLESFIQYRSPRAELGKILGLSSFISFAGVLVAAGTLSLFLVKFGWSARSCYYLLSGLTGGLTIIAFITIPDFFLRFLATMITRFIYKIKMIDIEHIPSEGPALIIPNHISWVDALLIISSQQRRVRFLMSREVYDRHPVRKWLATKARVIPIQSGEGPEKIKESLRLARNALDEGYLVCIFAEGHISRNGIMMGFRKGFAHILDGTDYPIIPMYIAGAWGSISSYANGLPFKSLPKQFPYPITLVAGQPMQGNSTPFQVRQSILELSSRYFEERKKDRRSMGVEFIRCARKNWGDKALSDSLGTNLTYAKTLVAALIMKKRLARIIPKEEQNIACLMPTSVGGALANIALALLGKTSVNLNYTAGSDSMNSAIKQADIRYGITSKKFLKKLGEVPLPENTIYLEDLMDSISAKEKTIALIKAKTVPARSLDAWKNFAPDDVLTIIFSSGSTGEPKGVMLSHHNIISNIESVRSVLGITVNDDIASALPFFHSFGFTSTIWFPLISGFSASYHPNPLDASRIAKLVRENKSTMLLSTPTFLNSYMRKASPEDFATLDKVIVGAEKLKPSLAQAFHEKYGGVVLEGYGATELSPLATVSVPNRRVARVNQIGRRDGSVGVAAPGVVIKPVNPDTGEDCGVDEEGLLLIKGPNVMIGYLGKPELTAEVIKDGWYNTGDIAKIDRDGFIQITDRLSRFSKVAGEMVPHTGVEEKILTLLETDETVIAVTGIPDEKKGEQLALIYTDAAGTAESLQALIAGADIPNLWKPAAKNYIHVEEIPVLGTGKMDLKAIKDIANKSD